MSEPDEGIRAQCCKACFTGSLKIRRARSASSQEPKGSLRAKQSQTKLAGQVLHQRSSQQRDGDYGSGFIETERRADWVHAEICDQLMSEKK
jgi:hypothetical protein